MNGPLSGTTRVSRYRKGKTNLDFTEARDSEWQWHQLGRMQVCTSLQRDNHANTRPLSLLQAGCPSCRPTNSVKALKASAELTWTDSDRSNCTQTQNNCNDHDQSCRFSRPTTTYHATPHLPNSKLPRYDHSNFW